MECAEVGHLETGEHVLFHVPHAIFHPAFFIALAGIARDNGKAVVPGTVEILGIEHRGFPQGALEHGGFEMIHHDFLRNATKEVKGVLMAGEAVLHGLGDGKLHVHHGAVAQDHDKETQPSLRLAYRDRAERTPIDLRTLAGREGQREKGGPLPGSDGSHRRFDQRIATVKAMLAQTLEDLSSRIGIFFQHADDLLFKGIEFAGALMWPAGPKVLLGQPVGHGAGIERQLLGDLRSAQSLVCMEVFDLAKTLIVNHGSVSARCLKMSLIAMGVSAAVILRALGAGPRGG
jgi:hypothetical protein